MNCRTEVWRPVPLSAICPTCFLTTLEGNLSLVSNLTVPCLVSGHWGKRQEHIYSVNLYMLVLSLKVTRGFSPGEFLYSKWMYKHFDYVLRWTMTFQHKAVSLSLHQCLLLLGGQQPLQSPCSHFWMSWRCLPVAVMTLINDVNKLWSQVVSRKTEKQESY